MMDKSLTHRQETEIRWLGRETQATQVLYKQRTWVGFFLCVMGRHWKVKNRKVKWSDLWFLRYKLDLRDLDSLPHSTACLLMQDNECLLKPQFLFLENGTENAHLKKILHEVFSPVPETPLNSRYFPSPLFLCTFPPFHTLTSPVHKCLKEYLHSLNRVWIDTDQNINSGCLCRTLGLSLPLG